MAGSGAFTNLVRSRCYVSATTLIFLTMLTPSLQISTMGELTTDLLNRAFRILGYETCEHPAVHNEAVSRLKTSLKNELFGQHLAVNITLAAVKAHLEDRDPQKALVLSLHGWAGAGKTFTTQHMMNALYENGVSSSFVRFFISSYHFPDPNNVTEYKDLIKRNVQQVIRNCPRALFIFDEVDKTPPGVLDVLVSLIQHPGKVLDGYDYKKAIYVFLSNTGANDITNIAQKAWKEGRKREDLTFKDFASVLSNEAFNSAGGLYRSRIIDKVLVDFFVPFLPLERQHVISCIKVEAKRHGMDSNIIDDEAEKIADMLTYWPADIKLYSTTGCKRVDTFVKYRIAELDLANDDDEDSSDETDHQGLKSDL